MTSFNGKDMRGLNGTFRPTTFLIPARPTFLRYAINSASGPD